MGRKRTMVARRAVLIAGPLAGLFALGGRGFGQEFPTGPITFVVAFPPGGSIDVVMRAMAPKLQERLGKPVVIENRVGAGGNIAAAAVASAPPDGHTLLAPASSLAANPTLIKHMPFDTLKDLQPIALLFRTPLALVVHRGAPPALNDVMAGHVGTPKTRPDKAGHEDLAFAHGIGTSSPSLPACPGQG